jgi:E3 ubiquitin-protein ligase MARCH6
VVIGDVVFAFALGFLPFSLGRIALCCISCFSFGNMDIDHSYASTASILLIGYGLILSLVLLLTALHTFQQYSRGEHLTISIFFMVLPNSVHWLSTPFRMLPGIHVMVDRTFTFLTQFIIWSISLGNVSLNLTLILVICPLFFGWSLDISTSKLFGVTMSQKLKFIFASSYASTALHWLIGCICLKLRSLLSSFLCPVWYSVVVVSAFYVVCN